MKIKKNLFSFNNIKKFENTLILFRIFYVLITNFLEELKYLFILSFFYFSYRRINILDLLI